MTPQKWMVEDFTKIGMSSGVDRYYRYRPILSGISFDGNTVAVDCSMPTEACERFGCPREIQYILTFEENGIHIDFAWFGKDKNRMAEAMWLIHLAEVFRTIPRASSKTEIFKCIFPTERSLPSGSQIC